MRDRAPVFIALSDLLICLLCYVLIAVAPAKSKTEGVRPKAEYLIQAEWDVNRDIDVDLWVIPPTRKAVFYGSRQVGCADLDRDSLGFNTQHIVLDDGSVIREKSNVETTSIRCIQPGHWDVGVNLFSYHTATGDPVSVHVEITGINPSVRTVWAGDIPLTHAGQTVNAVSFEMGADGKLTLVPTPLETVTSAYEKEKAGSPP